MRPSMALRDRHLADLHRRARELGVPRYRMLPRDELIEAVEEREGRGAAEPAGREEAIDAGFERPRHEPEEGREDEQSAKAEPRPSHRREPESSEPAERLAGGGGGRLRLGFADPPLRASSRRRGERSGSPAAPWRATPRPGQGRDGERTEPRGGAAPLRGPHPGATASPHSRARRRARSAGPRGGSSRPARLRATGARSRPAALGPDHAPSRSRLGDLGD